MSDFEERMKVLCVSFTSLTKIKVRAHSTFVPNSLDIFLSTAITRVVLVNYLGSLWF